MIELLRSAKRVPSCHRQVGWTLHHCEFRRGCARTGRYVRPGGSDRVVDYRQQKADLARLAAAEAEQIAAAQHRLATGSPIRLSEIGELDPTEFHLFLGHSWRSTYAQDRPRSHSRRYVQRRRLQFAWLQSLTMLLR